MPSLTTVLWWNMAATTYCSAPEYRQLYLRHTSAHRQYRPQEVGCRTRGALLGSFSGLTSGWRLWLTQHDETRDGNTVTCKLAENTVRRLCGRARQYFRAAQKRRIIDSNPFGEMKDIKVRSTKAPIFHWPLRCQKGYRCVPRCAAETDFALSRFWWLCCPSEHLSLCWGDINWERERMTVHSSKTERHEGKDSRVVPIFPELRPHLDAGTSGRWREEFRHYSLPRLEFETPHAITPDQGQSWRRSVAAAVPESPQHWRETESAENFPDHVVCAWNGNSERVVREHYLQITDDHFKLGVDGHPAIAPQKVPQSVANPREMEGIPRYRGVLASSPKNLNSTPSGNAPVGLEPTT